MPPMPLRREQPSDPVPLDTGAVFDFGDGSGQSGSELLQDGDQAVTTVDFSQPQEQASPYGDPNDPKANLALFMSDSDLDALAAEMLDKIDEDKKSSEDWYQTVANAIELLGINKTERTFPFQGASGAYDPLMAEAVYRCYAKARGELLPADGPVKTQVIGAITDEATDRAFRVKAWMNLYFTRLAPEYYTDYDQMLFWWSIAGSVFKKVYQDPIKGRPVAPFILPRDFVVAYDTTSLDNCVRATHECRLSQREVMLRQMAGPNGEPPLWRNISLGEPDTDLTSDTYRNPIRIASDSAEGMNRDSLLGDRSKFLGDSAWEVPECHADLDLTKMESFPDKSVPAGLPVPYRVTLARNARKVLAIYRNYRPGDQTYTKRNWFVHYKLLPGTGFYGFGFAHILNNSAWTGTALTRQIIDGTTLSMFSGGVRAKGMKIENNNLMIGPCEFPEIDTGGLPINQVFQSLPVREVSPVSLDLLKFNVERSENLANTMDIAVGEGRQDAPVGTTMALMEAANVLSSVMIKNGYVSQRREFEAFQELFGENLPDTPYPFPVRASTQNPTGMSVIMRQDFQPGVEILPVGDPNITSSAQRMMRSEVLSTKAHQNPGLYNVREVERVSLEAMNLDDSVIDRILPPPQQGQPSDPLTENQMALAGAPLAAAAWQDHDAHIAVHQSLAQMPTMTAHIAQHLSMKMRAQIEAVIGRPLPQGKLPPQIENQVALLTAKAMQVVKQQQGNSITQDQIIQAELKNEADKIAAKVQGDQGKAAVDAFKANLEFQSQERDRGIRLRIAEINAASGLADNQVPPPEYVKQVLDLGNQEIPGTTDESGQQQLVGIEGALAAHPAPSPALAAAARAAAQSPVSQPAPATPPSTGGSQ